MKPTDLHQTIAAQIDNMKPADLRPGIDVGMEPLNDTTLLVRVLPATPNDARSRDVQITYDEGPDLYNVAVFRLGERTEHERIYCDQLGEIVFGSEAEAFTMPMVQISDDDGETWTVIG